MSCAIFDGAGVGVASSFVRRSAFGEVGRDALEPVVASRVGVLPLLSGVSPNVGVLGVLSDKPVLDEGLC